ncbi:hypothetical protein R3P38DRAFT_3193031 [Favolaschia claudopus]|uniref:Uncharacterized protein n=1 Tax=Favolaschia claudopus TaxID=2862362 RepID=A0AAW0BIT8_9AGAR
MSSTWQWRDRLKIPYPPHLLDYSKLKWYARKALAVGTQSFEGTGSLPHHHSEPQLSPLRQAHVTLSGVDDVAAPVMRCLKPSQRYARQPTSKLCSSCILVDDEVARLPATSRRPSIVPRRLSTTIRGPSVGRITVPVPRLAAALRKLQHPHHPQLRLTSTPRVLLTVASASYGACFHYHTGDAALGLVSLPPLPALISSTPRPKFCMSRSTRRDRDGEARRMMGQPYPPSPIARLCSTTTLASRLDEVRVIQRNRLSPLRDTSCVIQSACSPRGGSRAGGDDLRVCLDGGYAGVMIEAADADADGRGYRLAALIRVASLQTRALSKGFVICRLVHDSLVSLPHIFRLPYPLRIFSCPRHAITTYPPMIIAGLSCDTSEFGATAHENVRTRRRAAAALALRVCLGRRPLVADGGGYCADGGRGGWVVVVSRRVEER